MSLAVTLSSRFCVLNCAELYCCAVLQRLLPGASKLQGSRQCASEALWGVDTQAVEQQELQGAGALTHCCSGVSALSIRGERGRSSVGVGGGVQVGVAGMLHTSRLLEECF
jgi:hypothetical protein